MMIDSVKISIHVSEEQETQIYNVLHSLNSKNYKKNKATGKKKYWYNDVQYDYSVELVLPWNDLYITFNPCRVKKSTVNVGTVTNKELKYNTKIIKGQVENLLEIKLPNFRDWKLESIEINKDTIHKSIEEKEEVLKALKLNDAGHLQRMDNNGKWNSWKKRGLKIKFYDKQAEVLEHYGKDFKLPLSVSKSDLAHMTRLEVTLEHRMLLPTLNKLLGTNKKIITLGELLNPYVLAALYNSVMVKFNLSNKIKSYYKTIKTINEKITRKDVQNNLINFIKLINEKGVYITKQKLGNTFYRYRKMLEIIGVTIMCLPRNANYTFNALLDYNFANLNLLKDFTAFFNIPVSMYNMHEFFNTFKSFTIPIRL